MPTRVALGIDIGGTKIAAALVAPDGRIHGLHQVATPTNAGAESILQATIAAGQYLLGHVQSTSHEVVAIGIGSAGHVDHTRGTIRYASGTLPGWTGMELGPRISAALGLPVSADNDVNTMALGEQHFGAGRAFRHALYLTVGTGVGGALVHAGELWRGASWTAGEIGHLVVDWNGTRRCSCGRTGHLEAYTAGPAITERYRQTTASSASLDLRDIVALAHAGDIQAQQAIAEGAQILGTALGGLLSVLDPEAVIIGGGVAEIGDLWWHPLTAALRDAPMPGPARVPLLPAQLGVRAVLIGAAWLAFSEQGLATTDHRRRTTDNISDDV